MAGVDHEFLHVRRERVERDGAAERQAHHGQAFARILEQNLQAAALGVLLGGQLEVHRFVHRAAQPHHRNGGCRPDDERDPPAQTCICSAVSNCCKMIWTPSASSWPLVSVTYWNEE
jgi:hypothetical protein